MLSSVYIAYMPWGWGASALGQLPGVSTPCGVDQKIQFQLADLDIISQLFRIAFHKSH
jgi:hypothetical protein